MIPRILAKASLPLGVLAIAVSCAAAPSVPPDRAEALVRGYPALYRHMQNFGCPRCHTTGPQILANEFRLPAPGQDDEQAVRMLWRRLDPAIVENSKLVRKPNGELGHRGGKILNAARREEWIAALRRWQQS